MNEKAKITSCQKGHWIPYAEIDGKTIEWVCSSCRHIKSTTNNRTKECPNCGAKMESGEM